MDPHLAPPEQMLPVQGDHAPAAEPVSIAKLQECLVRAAEARHPLWLAYLAGYLQVIASVRLATLKRSHPVREYHEWIEFFCS